MIFNNRNLIWKSSVTHGCLLVLREKSLKRVEIKDGKEWKLKMRHTVFLCKKTVPNLQMLSDMASSWWLLLKMKKKKKIDKDQWIKAYLRIVNGYMPSEKVSKYMKQKHTKPKKQIKNWAIIGNV